MNATIDFSSLENKSKTINKHSDELTEALTAINGKLNLLNLGIEVIDGPTLETVAESDEFETHSLLGYGKLHGSWGLVVTTKSFRKKTEPYTGQERWVAATTGDTEFLLSSPRRLRIKAVDCIEKLVELLEKEADNLGVAVGKAKKMAEKL